MSHKILYPIAGVIVLLGLLFFSLGGNLPAQAQQETPEPQILTPSGDLFENQEDNQVSPLVPDDQNALPLGVWVAETVDNSGNVGPYTSLELDSTGYPHISYYDSGNGDLKYAYQDASGWHTEVVDSLGNVGLHTSLELDNAGNPHISYLDLSNKRLKYAYRSAYGWQIEVVDSNVVYHSSMALDLYDRPHIAYYRSTTSPTLFDLALSYKSGGVWYTSTVERNMNWTCGLSQPISEGKTWLSLQFNNDNVPTITYCKAEEYYIRGFRFVNCRLKLAYSTGSKSTLDSGYQSGSDFRTDVGYFPSHVFDSANHIHVSYQSGSSLKYYGPNGSILEPSSTGSYSSIGLDPSGYAFISHYQSSSHDLRLTYRDSGGWHAEAVDTEGDVGKYASIAIDRDGLPVVSNFGNSALKLLHYGTSGIYLRPLQRSGAGASGAAVSYEFTLYNLNRYMDSFYLDIVPGAWKVVPFTNPVGPVPGMAAVPVTLTVMIPDNAQWYSTDIAEVIARSTVRYPQVTNPVRLTTQAYAPPQLSFDPQFLESTQWTGELVSRTLDIRNGSGVTLTYALEQEWSTLLLHHLEPTSSITPTQPSTITFMDSSGYGNNGSCGGAHCPQVNVPGRLSNGVVFDGFDDAIKIPDAPSLNPRHAIAISAWIYPLDWNSNRRILQKADEQYRLNITGFSSPYPAPSDDGEARLEFALQGVGSLSVSPPSLNAWHHVVGNYDGSKMQLWIDGLLSAEISATGLIGVTDAPLYIGTEHHLNSSYTFHGWIDEVAILSRAMTPDEIAMAYRDGYPDLASGWLAIHPSQGSLLANTRFPVQACFNSTGIRPGLYTVNLRLSTNDPLNTLIIIPVRMQVVELPYHVYMPVLHR
jgi:hypothetical protein